MTKLVQTGKSWVMPTVLVIESDDELRVALASSLRAEGYTAIVASTGQSGIEMVRRGGIELIVTEYALEDMEGEKLVRNLKTDPISRHVPLLIVSHKCSQSDRIRGLELGADDFIRKPVSRREIVLRVNISMRRYLESAQPSGFIRYDLLQIESLRRRVLVDHQELALTPIEFRLLTVLADRPDQVQSRQSLLAEVWGMQSYLETRTVDVHIKRLREKLGKAAGYICTVRGIGYRFCGDNADTTRSAAS
jgi:two-component system, OmpR family, phosphate regulon response regulator PhoB